MTLLELTQKYGLNPKKVSSTNGGEYHSPCPQCGGTDRFFIQPYRKMRNCLGSYCCRRCNTRGDTIEFARQFLNYTFHEAVNIAQEMNGVGDTLLAHKLKVQLRHRTIPPNKFKKIERPPQEWVMQATALTNQAHRALMKQPKIIDYLVSRGISKETIEQYKLGWLHEDRFPARISWGLETKNNQTDLWIPEGLVIPQLEDEKTMHIKVRRWNKTQKKYVIVSGGMSGMHVIGNRNNNMAIVVESELDALAIHSKMNDFAFAIATGGSQANPDNITDHVVKQARILCICYDNDEAGKRMFEKWKKHYPHAIDKSHPIGKDLGEAIIAGSEVKSWFYNQVRS